MSEMEITITVKEVLLELLREIRDICNENNITYSLYGNTAAQAIETEDIIEPFARIMVKNDDFVKLCNIMEKRHIKGRHFDSMHNNPNYMDYTARYSNSETTDITMSMKSNVFKCGVYVEIIPLRMENNSRIKHYFLRFLEHGWEKHFCKLTAITKMRYLLTVPFINFLKLFGAKKVSRWIFDQMAKGHSGEFEETCSIKEFCDTLYDFNFDPLKKTKKVTILEDEFDVTTKYNAVLKKMFSRNWKHKCIGCNYGFGNIIMLDVSYKQFERALKKNNNLWKKYFRKKSRQMFVKAISSFYDKQKHMVWSIAKRTGTRARLYFYYMPKMGVIRNLVANEDYYRLSEIMKLNRVATLLAYKDGTGFAVNKELFEIQLKLFRFEGNVELANRIEANTPKYYMKPIVDVNK
jgi:phosphorylcholine metabolism protein LicD